MTTTSILLGSGGGSAYTIPKSLRFRSSASAYLNRTPASATNQTTWTWSGWVKKANLSTYGCMFDAYTGAGATYCVVQWNNDNTLVLYNQTSSSVTLNLTTTALYRDSAAWYHVVAVYDSTQATSTNRAKLYVNGSQVTAFNTATYPTLNANATINSTVPHDVGRFGGASNYFDGYMAEVNFIDGQALTASSFGTYDANGVWQPVKYSGSFGTNGFYLNFGNTTSTTTLGYDTSGNSNNWTTNNISLTAGSTYDSMTDSPTVSSASVANYAVLNPLVPSTGTISNGNLGVSTATTNATATSFFPSSGKWYWENISTSGTASNTRFGIVNRSGAGADLGGTANGWAYLGDGRVYNNGATTSYGVTYTTNDILMIALDLDAGKVWYGKNGTWMASGSPSTGANPSQTFTANQQMSPAVASGTGTIVYAINCGQQPFTYTPPTGFNALNTYNLPTPTIANGAQYMAATTYTGNGSTQSINNGNNTTIATTFQPNLVWFKGRSGATNHLLEDSVRGAGYGLNSNLTNAESSGVGTGLTSFASTGFALSGDFSGAGSCNVNGTTYVAWQWQAGTAAGSSNTNGSITSTVSANTTAGFSVVTFNSNATAGATVGHGLGVVPSMFVIKSRSIVGDWGVYHASVGNTGGLILDTTAAVNTTVGFWNNTSPTSSVFTLGNGSTINPTSGTTMVAYCWAAVPGYSAFGSYTGNGSTDGPFVYTGFRPRFVLIKVSSTTGDWAIQDSSRSTYNAANALLWPDLSNAEYTTSGVELDYLSNGFKIRNTNGLYNTSAATYIYAAFAENPFNSSRAR